MNVLPQSLQDAIDSLRLLPGVGPRSAERYAYYLLRADSSRATEIADTIGRLHDSIAYCQKTFALVEKGKKYSDLYTDASRDKTTVAVVAEPFDIVALENTSHFKGTYHVLGGLVSPIDGVSPDSLHIKELIERIDSDNVTEIILATNSSVEGQSTALYIQQQIGDRPVKVTRLARGLPIGVDLEYADQITLTSALEGRQTL
ncbi:MAG TPA: recombination mediator RecR [Candidatus Saccharibacteria bacterium]|nr:recombination mediator RecR [Candidatus Saccharibacteria bacterium]